MSTEEQLSLFAEDSPVSHSVLPGSKEAHKMIAHSGLRCCELYRKWLPDGSLAKMFLESSRWNSTRCYLTWRSRVTPAGRLLFQLAPSMPTTGEIESGLLGTPTAIYKVRSERFREGRSPNPAEYALMHTPTATANQMAPSMQKHVGSWWRTPSADQGGTPKAEQPERFFDNAGRTWLPEPNVGRVANGVPNRSHRLKALGNAVVPPLVAEIGRIVMDFDQQTYPRA